MIGNWLRIKALQAKGWQIGPDVTIDPGACLEAGRGSIGAHTHIGAQCRIRGDVVEIGENCLIFSNTDILVKGTFRLGSRCKISRNVTIRGWDVIVGSELWCNENVEIGGGGWMKRSAVLTIGDHVHLGKGCSINVCAPVQIGSCTGIGIECMIFTHSSGNGQSVLEGYKHVEMPVTIGNHVSLFTRVIIAPGAVVHDGVTVGAMSYVACEAEPGYLYAGIPAKQKKRVVPPPREEQLPLLRKVLEEELSLPVQLEPASGPYGQVCILQHLEERRARQLELGGCETVVCRTSSAAAGGLAVFQLESMQVSGVTTDGSEAVRDALRRNGMLFDYQDYVPRRLRQSQLRSRGVVKG